LWTSLLKTGFEASFDQENLLLLPPPQICTLALVQNVSREVADIYKYIKFVILGALIFFANGSLF
jgi:hypothetical protein